MVFICAKAKKIEAFRSSATDQKNRNFCDEGAHHKLHRHNRIVWHTTSMPLANELEPSECKNIIRSLNGTESAGLNHYTYNSSFTYIDGLSFQV